MAKLFGSTTPTPTAAIPRSLIASAAQIPIDGFSWRSYRFVDETWQTELWRLYDLIGEFRFLANWSGSACGRVRLCMNEVDELGRVQGEVTDDPQVAALADTILGGPAARAEALRALGINLTVAGEAYIVGRDMQGQAADEWLVVSAAELRRWNNNVIYSGEGVRVPLREGQDILIRVWTPHPRRMWWADSPARSVMPVLVEIERLTKFVFSQIDSRLVGGGVWVLPNNIDVPQGDSSPTFSTSLMNMLAQAGTASIKGEGTASGVLPVIIEVPPDVFDKIKEPIRFESALSKEAMQLRAEALQRLALGMDTPPEVLSGSGGTNHWSAWHIEESTIKTIIEPLMNRICDGLNRAYIRSALKAMGKDPARYTLWYDTSPLTVRPQRLQDTLSMYNQSPGLVSADAVRRAGAYPESDAPTEEESLQRFIRELLLRDPSLFSAPAVRELAGITADMLPPDAVVAPAATPAPPPPAPQRTLTQNTPPPIPQNSTAQGAPAQPVTASALPDALALLVGCDVTVRRALEVAGGRLLDRQHRGKLALPRHELHTEVPVQSGDHAAQLLAGAWEHVPVLAQHVGLDPDVLRQTLSRYVTTLLIHGIRHDATDMTKALVAAGLMDRSHG